jgi:osmotically-inducible protein OsmY
MDDKQQTQKMDFRLLAREHPDTELAKRVCSILRWKIRYDSIRVRAEKGHVTLLGEVDWDLDRQAAEQTVRRLSGVVGITNLITTKPMPMNLADIKPSHDICSH